MRLLVYPHTLEIGGSQTNAIELAAAVRDRGHEALIFAQPGPLAERIAGLDLELVHAPAPRGRPSPRVMGALTRLVQEREIDLVHGYEWTTALEAYWGPRARSGVPAVATVMSMAVAPFLPSDLPVVVGTEQIGADQRNGGRSRVTVIEPPVDTRHNAPGVVSTTEFRSRHRLDPDAFTVVCVSRLAAELKLEGLLVAIDVVAEIAGSERIQLVIVGDGPSRDQVASRAEAANRRLGRNVVILSGELPDPRPAYAAADACLGMGGSALRAMAFARPVVVQGEMGFWEVVEAGTEERFLWTGWYGVGGGASQGPPRLESLLRALLADGDARRLQGARNRRLVEERFSLDRAARLQLDVYSQALAEAPVRPRRWLAAGGSSASKLATYRLRRRCEGLLGQSDADDFNSRPLVGVAAARTR
jgi:glycosyltransferase involved in cell wall biosynthesis